MAVRVEVRGVRGVLAAAALTPVVHDQMGVAECAPGQPGVRDAAAAVVADVLHHGGQRTRADAREHQPGLHRLSAPAVERHVVHVHGREPGVVGDECGVQAVVGRLCERLLPERVEVRRFLGLRAVLAQPLQRHVEQQGSSSSSG